MGTWYVAGVPYSNELYHHGILGQKWGVRRFQNKDGSYTEAGRTRYATKQTKEELKYVKRSAENSHWGKFISRDIASKTGRVNDKVRQSDIVKLRNDRDKARHELHEEEDKLWNSEKVIKRGELHTNEAFDKWINSTTYDGKTQFQSFLERPSIENKLKDLKRNADILDSAYEYRKIEMAKELVGSYGNVKIKDLTHKTNVQKVYETAIDFAVTNANAEDDYRRIFKNY